MSSEDSLVAAVAEVEMEDSPPPMRAVGEKSVKSPSGAVRGKPQREKVSAQRTFSFSWHCAIVPKTESLRLGRLQPRAHAPPVRAQAGVSKAIVPGCGMQNRPTTKEVSAEVDHNKSVRKKALDSNATLPSQPDPAPPLAAIKLSHTAAFGDRAKITLGSIVKKYTAAALQALIWGKDVTFDANAIGTDVRFRRWLKENSQFVSRAVDRRITHTAESTDSADSQTRDVDIR